MIERFSDAHLGGRKLVVGDVTLENFARAEEAFCTGTATVISPIEHVSDPTADGKVSFDWAPMGPVTTELRRILTGIQAETEEDVFNWLKDPFSDAFLGEHVAAGSSGVGGAGGQAVQRG